MKSGGVPAPSGSGRAPSDKKEVVAAKAATVGQENPVQSLFQCVPNADASELHGPAMGTLGGEHADLDSRVGGSAKLRQGFRRQGGVAVFCGEQPRP
jgi:hypothetical protein